MYRYLKYLWRKIIFNDPTLGVRLRGSLKNWDDLPRTKSLFCQPKGRGIVIGNLTSQLLSNIYLNDFDHYMSEWFGFDFYGRYVDDFMIVIDDAKRAIMPEVEDRIRIFLMRKGLRINKRKTYRQPISRGVKFLGVVIYPYRTILGQRVKKNFHQAATDYSEGRKDIDSLISYAGMTVHHNCVNLTLRNFEKAGVL